MRRSNLAIIARPNEIVPYKHNRVLIAHDHPVVRERSSAILRSEEDIKVVAETIDDLRFWNLFKSRCYALVLSTRKLTLPTTNASVRYTSATVKRGASHGVRCDMLNVRPAAPRPSRQQFSFQSREVIQHGSVAT